MTNMAIFKVLSGSIVAAFVADANAPAFAHHPMGGEVMTTVAQGMMSGLAHPVIEVDHLVFLVALGLLLVGQSRIILLASVFIGCSLIGVVARYQFGALSGLDLVVAVSVMAAGLLLWTKGAWRDRSLQVGHIAGLAFAGLAHGLAFGESILGSEATVLGGYLGGLALIQLALVVCVSMIGQALLSAGRLGNLRVRIAGTLVTAFGAAQLGFMLFGA
jgi:urease accessory protein